MRILVVEGESNLNDSIARKTCVLLMIALMLLFMVGCAPSSPPTTSTNAAPRAATASAAADPAAEPTAPGESPANQTVHAAATPAPASSGDLSVLFINVGKADAILVRAAGKAYLIDTGEKASVPQLIRALNLCNVNSLEAVFLTHTHSDHIGGMPALARNFGIGALYSAEISQNKKDGGNKIAELAVELSLSHKKLHAGDTVEVAPGIRFEVLGPLVYNAEDDNDNSLVLRLSMNGRTLLFTGDMQFAEEKTLLNAGADLSADILKVGDHGNPDATAEEFAAAVSPEYAVISTDTSVDTDSANSRAKSALGGAAILVTQDYGCGVLATIRTDGSIAFSDPEIPKTGAKIAVTGIDKDTQSITIQNKGEDIDISGYFILSRKGSEVFVFPKGSYLNAGQSVRVSCKKGEGDYEWKGESKIWNDKKGDAGILYDRYGNELARGIPH